jgi:hypothetical protein
LKPRPAQLVLLGVLGAAVLGACDSELALILAGKRCRLDRDPPCLGGYACIDGFCRVPGEVVLVPQDGGVGGGSSSDGGEATGGGVGGTPALGGAGSQGGTGPIIDIPDASIFLDGGPDGCVPLDLYRDVDGDSYGDTAQHAFGCIREGWVELPGDCREDLPLVNPGQAGFFGEGFSDPEKPGGISFNYDCNNFEEGDTNNNPPGAAVDCQGLLGLGVACAGSGYERTARGTADGVNDLCGSDIVITCVAPTLASCVSSPLAVLTPFKCR